MATPTPPLPLSLESSIQAGEVLVSNEWPLFLPSFPDISTLLWSWKRATFWMGQQVAEEGAARPSRKAQSSRKCRTWWNPSRRSPQSSCETVCIWTQFLSTRIMNLYRVSHLLVDLGWVDGCSTIYPNQQAPSAKFPPAQVKISRGTLKIKVNKTQSTNRFDTL